MEEGGGTNRNRLGWFLKTKVNRIVGGFELRQSKADGRGAWQVVEVSPPPSPALPPWSPSLIGDYIDVRKVPGTEV